MSHLPVGEAARRIGRGCKPRDISDLIYQGRIDPGACPIVAGRRMVPASLLPKITELLDEAGRLNTTITLGEVAGV